ncbi:glycosyltransferase family 39 protein [Actinoplanes sp. NBRC 101535]|uniref:glycosyltransferase family 39 protein n=1 Tax=Actinoplanes sp. NBRC 101535 TaxID=3032196 RepID=UPI0024A22A65|nr:glycosyltransferase family 39 protein [Actinoplanes sp. NBRC 101535]GLY02464.1 hypothetical protein Acsp01_28430 [Actinoplanes sp. NBRC 101535]
MNTPLSDRWESPAPAAAESSVLIGRRSPSRSAESRPRLMVTRIRRWLPAVVSGAAMLVIGLVGATRTVLSWDEIATADVADRTVAQIAGLAPHIDAVFSAYYLLMHVWTELFGDAVLSLRLPSILAMAGAAALTGELGRRLAGTTAGLVAGGLLCLVPNISRYAAEARPYAMACLFSVFALLLLFRALDRPGPGRWAGYGLALTGLGLFSLVGLVAVAGHVAILVIRRRLPRGWAVALLGTLLAVAPLIWWGLRQRTTQLHWVEPMTIKSVYAFPELLIGSPQLAWLLLGLLVVPLLLRPSRTALEMAAAALTPVVLICVLAFAGVSFWVNRYLLFALIPVAVAIAGSLTADRPPARLPRLSLIMLLVAASAVPGHIAVRQPTLKNGSDYRTMADVIRRDQLPGDAIVYSQGRTMRAGVDYYLRHQALRPRDVLMERSAARNATLRATEVADPATRLAGAQRVWLALYGRRTDPVDGRADLRPPLSRDFTQAGVWRVKNGTLALYVRSRK